MMDLKLCFSILIVCGMAESIITGKKWGIDAPVKISVLESSCAVIPCMYDYPTKGNTFAKWRGFWRRDDENVASNKPGTKLRQGFKGRSRITGTIESNDCTWELKDVRETDNGPFYLAIEIPRHEKYIFSNNSVYINVFRDPEPPIVSVAVRDKVTATCTVTHVCPSSPPKFSWSHAGKTEETSKKENKSLWSTTSTLTFTPTDADFNQPLNCRVNLNDKKTTKGSVLLTKKST